MEFKWPQVEMNNCVETRFLCISKPSESAVAEALNHELQNELSNVRKMNVVLVFWQIWSSSSSTQLHHTVHLHWASTALLFGFITEWKGHTKYIQQRVIIHTLFPHQTLEFSSTPFFFKDSSSGLWIYFYPQSLFGHLFLAPPQVVSVINRLFSLSWWTQAPWSSGTECVAKYNFQTANDQDLPFCKGDVLTIIGVTRVRALIVF